MNYYEHHLGDWAAATGHLTWDEDMAYTRLLRAYYHAERPIPHGQQYRLAKASTPSQRKAVDQVLSEFFELRDGNYHQKRADAEIERYQAGEPDREAKKANEDARLKRHREERARLFQELAAAGQHAPWNVGMNELRALVKRYCQPSPATAPATPATATHTPYPDTRHQEEPKGSSPAVAVPSPAPAAPLKAKDLQALGIDPQHAADWLALRKAKRLPLTPTAWADTVLEGRKAGLDPAKTVAKAVANNWAGFKASWLANGPGGKPPPSGPSASDPFAGCQ